MASLRAARRESRLGRTLGIATVALGGLVVGGVALLHALDPHEPFLGVVLSGFVIVATAVPSVGIAVWLHRSSYSTRDVYRVLAWSFLGGVPLAVLVFVVAGYQQSHGVYIHDLQFVVATVMGVGLVGGAFTGIHDVEREHRETAYRTVDDQFTTVVDAAPVAIIAVDDAGDVQLWNTAATELFGYDREAVLENSCPIKPLDGRSWCCCFGDYDGAREFECERADGSRIAVESRTTDLDVDDGSECRHLAIMSDVTAENRRRQRLTVLHRVLRHNLRNGINIAQGNAELLESWADSPDAARSVKSIIDVTEDLLALSEKAGQVERTLGDTRVAPNRIDLVALADRELDAARERFPHATFVLDAPEDVIVNAGQGIGTAIAEALENAVEHHDTDGPVVRVTVERPAGDDVVALSIADDGPGIPARERRAVEVGEETPTRHVSGLGLWLQSWLVSGYGGTISFEDNEPRGTVVTMRLPAARERTPYPVADPGAADIAARRTPMTDPDEPTEADD